MCFIKARALLIQRAPNRHASLTPATSQHRGRIHDGKEGGLFFVEGGEGQVEGCEIWGNAVAGVGVDGSSSQAVVKGCECAIA